MRDPKDQPFNHTLLSFTKGKLSFSGLKMGDVCVGQIDEHRKKNSLQTVRGVQMPAMGGNRCLSEGEGTHNCHLHFEASQEQSRCSNERTIVSTLHEAENNF